MKKISLSLAEVAHLREVYQEELAKTQHRVASLTRILSKLDELYTDNELITKELLDKSRGPLGRTPSRRGRKPAARTEAAEMKLSVRKGKVGRPRKQPSAVDQDPAGSAPRGGRVKATRGSKAAKAAGVAKASPKADQAKPKRAKAAPSKKAVGRKAQPSRRAPRQSIKKLVGGEKVKWSDFILNAVAQADAPITAGAVAAKASAAFQVPEADQKKLSLAIAWVVTRLVNVDKKLVALKLLSQRAKVLCLPEWCDENGALKPEYAERVQASPENQ